MPNSALVNLLWSALWAAFAYSLEAPPVAVGLVFLASFRLENLNDAICIGARAQLQQAAHSEERIKMERAMYERTVQNIAANN